MKTIENLKTDNWYYVQVFNSNHEVEHKVGYTICFASTPTECKDKLGNWIEKEKLSKDKINLYHKNYKLQAKKMVAIGNYID